MTKTCASLAAAAALSCGAAALAQNETLYVTSGNSGGTPSIIAIKNGAIIGSVDVSGYTSGQGPGGITVDGDVRVIGQFQGGGVQTDLNLNITGPSFGALPFGDSYDGTTDGKFNYLTDYATGDIYRTNRDYTNAQLLYNNGGQGTIGITYNPLAGILYTHDTNTSTIYEHDTSGNYVGQFQLDFSGNWRGLAFDPKDSTLWLTEHSPDSGDIRQVDLFGNTLQTINIPNLNVLSPNAGPLGAEFNLGSVPAPGGAALLGLGGLVAARRRRA